MPGARPAPRHARGSVRQAATHPTRSAPLTVTARWDLGRGTQPLPGTQAWRCFCAHLFISTARSGPSWGPRLGHRPTCAPAATSGPPSQLPRPRRSFAPVKQPPRQLSGGLVSGHSLQTSPPRPCLRLMPAGKTLTLEGLAPTLELRTAWQAAAHPPEQPPLPLASLPGPPTPGSCPRRRPLQGLRERQGWLGDAHCSGCPHPIAAVALMWLVVSGA